MVQENRGGPPRGDNRGGDNRGGDNRGGGERRGGGGGERRGGRPPKGGFGKGAPEQKARVETYESLKALTRGEGFRIDKYVLAEKGTHRPVKTEYRLTRDGVAGVQSFGRLVDATTASTAPLPEPEPEVTEGVETELNPEQSEATLEETPEEFAESENPEHVTEG